MKKYVLTSIAKGDVRAILISSKQRAQLVTFDHAAAVAGGSDVVCLLPDSRRVPVTFALVSRR